MEIWKDIPGYEWYYQISSLWRIKSVERYVMHYSWIKTIRRSRILKVKYEKLGYVSVCLSKENNKKDIRIHRWMTFLPNENNKKTINHINWNKHDNRLENLEWMTQTENIRHAFDTWLILRFKK